LAKLKTISIIIPVYRNEGSLLKTYNDLHKILNVIKYEYEIIFIDDGSDDGSLAELKIIRDKDSKVKIISFSRNFGQLSAIQAGMEYATGDILVNISADMQDPVVLITEMVEAWEKGSKIVICTRKQREDGLSAMLTSKLFYGMVAHALPAMPKNGYDYFLLDRNVYKQLVEMNEHNYFLQGNILWMGYRPAIIEYTRKKRMVGKSQWSFTKKSKYFIDGYLSVSYLPIRFMSLMGVLFSISALVYGVVVFIAWAFNDTPFQGYTPIMIIMLLVSGLTMTILGIMGEYIWRIYDELRNKPRYIIDEVID